MPVSGLILGLIALAAASAIVAVLTRKKALYWVALTFGALAGLIGAWVAITVLRM